MGRQALQGTFYPDFDVFCELLAVHPARGHGLADDDLHGTGIFDKLACRPAEAGVVRDRDQRHSGRYRQSCATAAVWTHLPHGDTRPLRVDQDIVTGRQALLALRKDLPHRLSRIAAIDCYGSCRRQSPAKKWHSEQLPLEDGAHRAQQALKIERFPGGLVLAECNVGHGRQMLPPHYSPFHTAGHPQPRNNQRIRTGYQRLPWAIRQEQA